MTQVSTRVAGIPAIAEVTSAKYTKPNPNTWASDWDFYGSWSIDWELCDRTGRPAPWLTKKMTPDDEDRIELEIIDHLEAEC